MMKIFLIIVFLGVWMWLGYKQQVQNHVNNKKEVITGNIKVTDSQFTDTYGREVIFSGLNYVCKDPALNYILPDSLEVFRQLKSWGINCLRMGLIWDGIEPEPGKYNEPYLDAIEKKVKWAAENHIYVMLDMHQDLFSRKFSDGAPLWATLDEGQPHQTGPIWSDAYLMSLAVQKSFDNFWANKSAPDGIGIQDHYISMWKHMARRFSKYANIVGYDIMNEPFIGSGANAVMPLILAEYAKILADETGQTPPSMHELNMIWANEKSRLEVLKKLSKAQKYTQITNAAVGPNRQFETTVLQPFYQRATDAIRMVDQDHIIFLEHGYFSNPGIRTSIEPVKGKDGHNDPQQAYAAHAYDLIVDTKDGDQQSNDRVEFIFNRIGETAKRMNMPVVIGEWGAFYGLGENYVPSARFILGLIERYRFGNAYWAFRGTIADAPCFRKALLRAYPQSVSGKLNSYGLNYKTGEFTCSWKENKNITAPTVIFVPDRTFLEEGSLRLVPATHNIAIQPIANSKAAYLVVPVTGKNVGRTLSFRLDTNQTGRSDYN
jgi:endoglycosylceramidase